MHISSIRKKQACAVFKSTKWHRAIIKSEIKNGQIKVHLVDENSTKLVKGEDIKYFMEMFK